MNEWLSRNKEIVVPLFLLLVSFVILSRNSMSRHEAKPSFFARGMVGTISYIERGITYTITGIRDIGRNYIALVGARKEVFRLQKRLAQVKEENLALREQSLENERLRRLLGFKESVPYKMLPARVIAGSLSASSKILTINRGTKDGLKPGMAVVSYNGIVGQIINEPGQAMSAHSAPVMLILDRRSKIYSIVQRIRAHGVIQGRGQEKDDSLDLKDLDLLADVQMGDTVISSGLGGVFPKGLLVGTVTEVKRETGELAPVAMVKPSVEFSKLEEALIIVAEEPVE